MVVLAILTFTRFDCIRPAISFCGCILRKCIRNLSFSPSRKDDSQRGRVRRRWWRFPFHLLPYLSRCGRAAWNIVHQNSFRLAEEREYPLRVVDGLRVHRLNYTIINHERAHTREREMNIIQMSSDEILMYAMSYIRFDSWKMRAYNSFPCFHSGM